MLRSIINSHPRLRKVVIAMRHGQMPLPTMFFPVIRMSYNIIVFIIESIRQIFAWLFVSPIVRSLCVRPPKGLRVEQVPYICGSGDIEIGDDVYLSGKISIGFSLRGKIVPKFTVGSKTFIGHNCSFNMAKKIVIGKECLLAGGVVIRDNNGHPTDSESRRAGEPVKFDEIKAVVINDGVWIGRGSTIMAGVTIGENAVIGAGSIVTKDVPANVLSAGVPAKIIRRLTKYEDNRPVSRP